MGFGVVVGFGVAVGVGVEVGFGVVVGLGVEVGVGVDVGFGVVVGFGVAVAVGVEVGFTVGAGVAVAPTTTGTVVTTGVGVGVGDAIDFSFELPAGLRFDVSVVRVLLDVSAGPVTLAFHDRTPLQPASVPATRRQATAVIVMRLPRTNIDPPVEMVPPPGVGAYPPSECPS